MTKEEVIKNILSNDYYGEEILKHMKDFSISIDDLLNDDGAPDFNKKVAKCKIIPFLMKSGVSIDVPFPPNAIKDSNPHALHCACVGGVDKNVKLVMDEYTKHELKEYLRNIGKSEFSNMIKYAVYKNISNEHILALIEIAGFKNCDSEIFSNAIKVDRIDLAQEIISTAIKNWQFYLLDKEGIVDVAIRYDNVGFLKFLEKNNVWHDCSHLIRALSHSPPMKVAKYMIDQKYYNVSSGSTFFFAVLRNKNLSQGGVIENLNLLLVNRFRVYIYDFANLCSIAAENLHEQVLVFLLKNEEWITGARYRSYPLDPKHQFLNFFINDDQKYKAIIDGLYNDNNSSIYMFRSLLNQTNQMGMLFYMPVDPKIEFPDQSFFKMFLSDGRDRPIHKSDPKALMRVDNDRSAIEVTDRYKEIYLLLKRKGAKFHPQKLRAKFILTHKRVSIYTTIQCDLPAKSLLMSILQCDLVGCLNGVDRQYYKRLSIRDEPNTDKKNDVTNYKYRADGVTAFFKWMCEQGNIESKEYNEAIQLLFTPTPCNENDRKGPKFHLFEVFNGNRMIELSDMYDFDIKTIRAITDYANGRGLPQSPIDTIKKNISRNQSDDSIIYLVYKKYGVDGLNCLMPLNSWGTTEDKIWKFKDVDEQLDVMSDLKEKGNFSLMVDVFNHVPLDSNDPFSVDDENNEFNISKQDLMDIKDIGRKSENFLKSYLGSRYGEFIKDAQSSGTSIIVADKTWKDTGQDINESMGDLVIGGKLDKDNFEKTFESITYDPLDQIDGNVKQVINLLEQHQDLVRMQKIIDSGLVGMSQLYKSGFRVTPGKRAQLEIFATGRFDKAGLELQKKFLKEYDEIRHSFKNPNELPQVNPERKS